MPATSCPYCRSTRLWDQKMTAGQHHAKRMCLDCGRFVCWLPKPRPAADGEIPAEIRPLIHKREKPASLRGSEKQIGLARGYRSTMISFANKTKAPDDYFNLLMCINDASWFIANYGTTYPALRCWPRPDQIEAPKEVSHV